VTKASVLFDGQGNRLVLGAQLGRGGEGAVYALSGSGDVAKLYHAALNTEKQTKLRFMAQARDPDLSAYAAWPSRTVHDRAGGPVVGFVMASVGARFEIHTLYSPAQRRQEHPNLAWDFLLCVARNTAAAFEALHERGHVLGDVNQGNVMVGSDGRVVLIDCDSFQVRADAKVHLCEVGVPEFTSPELQGITSFASVARTVNHDNFGLALLVFHLLMGGRHPYAGVPTTRAAGQSLEGDVKAFRYAYANDAARRGNGPPPNSIPIGLLPAQIQAMFEGAFLERGAQSGRPTAQQWRVALDELRKSLQRCAHARMHVYPKHVLSCPWCALEARGVVYFLSLDAPPSAAVPSRFDATKTWATIRTIALPAPPAAPDPSQFPAMPRALPPGMPQPVHVLGVQVLLGCVAALLSWAAPKFVWLFGIAAFVACVVVEQTRGAARTRERAARAAAATAARRSYDALTARLKNEGAVPAFEGAKRQLQEAHNEWSGLDASLNAELAKLKTHAMQRQKERYLERFLIASATINGVGPAKKAALRSFGIETAADIVGYRVKAVPGFGDALTKAMERWKAGHAATFVFDARIGVAPADEAAARNRIAARRATLERQLANGAGELMRMRREAAARSQALVVQIRAAAQAVAQTTADLSVF